VLVFLNREWTRPPEAEAGAKRQQRTKWTAINANGDKDFLPQKSAESSKINNMKSFSANSHPLLKKELKSR
jgi:hypothetical protein